MLSSTHSASTQSTAIIPLPPFIHPLKPRINSSSSSKLKTQKITEKTINAIPLQLLKKLSQKLEQKEQADYAVRASSLLKCKSHIKNFTIPPYDLFKMASIHRAFADFIFNKQPVIFYKNCYKTLQEKSGNPEEFERYFPGKNDSEKAKNFERISGYKFLNLFNPLGGKKLQDKFQHIFNQTYFTISKTIENKLQNIGEHSSDEVKKSFYETSLVKIKLFNPKLKLLPLNLIKLEDLQKLETHKNLLFIHPRIKAKLQKPLKPSSSHIRKRKTIEKNQFNNIKCNLSPQKIQEFQKNIAQLYKLNIKDLMLLKIPPNNLIKMASLNEQFEQLIFNKHPELFLKNAYSALQEKSGNPKEFERYFPGKNDSEKAENFERITGYSFFDIFKPIGNRNLDRAFKNIFNSAYFTLKSEILNKFIYKNELGENSSKKITYYASVNVIAFFDQDLKILPKELTRLKYLKYVTLKGRLIFIPPELNHLIFSD